MYEHYGSIWSEIRARKVPSSAFSSILKKMFKQPLWPIQTMGHVSRKLRTPFNTGTCFKPMKKMEVLILQARQKAKHFPRPYNKSEWHSPRQLSQTWEVVLPGNPTPPPTRAFLPESKWVVLALFSFPSGLYFGSELREDRHKGFKISKTLSTVVPTGMTFGYAFTGQM